MGEVGQARSTGLEPVTQGLEIPCSIQLSYERFSPVDNLIQSAHAEICRLGQDQDSIRLPT
jgi:hypothetical protein